MENLQTIRAEAEKITVSGALGRSRSYRRLFAYLLENTLAGRTPKEIEIAAEVFGKPDSFDPTQDSMVRVYAHNLRQKLEKYYDAVPADGSAQLFIPRGEYRLAVRTLSVDPEVAAARAARRAAAQAERRYRQAALLMLVAGIAVGFLLARAVAPGGAGVPDTPLWQAVVDDDLPVTVVVGDYYIFGELDERGDIVRFVREFEVNSEDDLGRFVARSQARVGRYQDLDLTYLPHSAAAALGDVLGVLNAAGKRVDVLAMSEFDPAAVRSTHIVYIGYLSALDKLIDFVFSASELAVGATFDELVQLSTGARFLSDAGNPADFRNYRDYGYLGTFPGPAANQFVIVAGTRDEGVLYSAQAAADPVLGAAGTAELPGTAAAAAPAFELLFEVTGFDRTHIDARRVHTAPLDAERIWNRGPLPGF